MTSVKARSFRRARVGMLVIAAACALACSRSALPAARASELRELSRTVPVAVLFTIPGCRYCDIAERGFVGARRDLEGVVVFRKLVVNGRNFGSLRESYQLQTSMPQARLLLPGGRWRSLPLTRDGTAVARAIRSGLNGP